MITDSTLIHSLTLCQLDTWSQGEYAKLQEQRGKMKEDHERVIQEELLKMEQELQEEQVGADSFITFLPNHD